MSHQSWEYLSWFEVQGLLKGQIWKTPEGKSEKTDPGCITPMEPAKVARILTAVDFRPALYYDNLPVGRYRVRQFVLTNVRGRVNPVAGSELLGMYSIDATAEEIRTPAWSFTVHGYQAAWDEKAHRWKHGKWVKEETIQVGFLEGFRVLLSGDDYYFLTDSGSLYRAPRPAKGTHRQLKATYANPSGRVVAFLTDADTNRVFLFRRAVKDGGKPSVAELAPRLAWREYDPTLYRPGSDGPSELRRVVGYARVLQALGLVSKAAPTARP